MEFSLFCIGNPMVDIIAPADEEFLEKYSLKVNNQTLYNESIHTDLFDVIKKNKNVIYKTGGAGLNTIKIFRWMSSPDIPPPCFCGILGLDSIGDIVAQSAVDANIHSNFLRTTEYPTGYCAVLINDKKDRTLVANPQAGEHYNQSAHLDLPEIWHLVERSNCYYFTGFFFPVGFSSMMKIAKHSVETNKKFCLNLASVHFVENFLQMYLDIMPYVDYLFSNEDELQSVDASKTLLENILMLQQIPHINPNKSRVVVCTCGKNPTMIVHGKESYLDIKSVLKIEQEEIIDSNGAGDFFVGGFLSQLVLDKPLWQCVAAGHYAAYTSLRISGFDVPSDPPGWKI